MIYYKDFKKWHALKEAINEDERVPTFRKREIWWCSINNPKGYPFHFSIHYKGIKEKEIKERQAVLSQLRAYDSIRLTRLHGNLSSSQFEELLKALHSALDGL